MREERRQYVIYVAGKLFDNDPVEEEFNINIARNWAEKIWLSGFTAICPHLNTLGICRKAKEDGTMTGNDFLEGDFHILDRCDGIFMIPENWKISEGAIEELAHAKQNGQMVFYKFENLLLHKWQDPWAVDLGGDNE